MAYEVDPRTGRPKNETLRPPKAVYGSSSTVLKSNSETPAATKPSTTGTYTLGTEAGANIYNQVARDGKSRPLTDGTVLSKDTSGKVIATRNGTVYDTNVTYVDREEELLREQLAAQREAELANLRTAYNKSMRGYEAEEDEIPIRYTAAKNDAAAQDAIAKKNFDEQAVVTGLNTGTSGQAALSRSAVYRGVLADLTAGENKALEDIARKKAELTADYNTAVATAKSTNDAQLASALYQKLLADEASAAKDAATAKATAQAELENHLKMGGKAADVPDLVAASGWTAAQIAAKETYYAELAAQNIKKTNASANDFATEVYAMAKSDDDMSTNNLKYWQSLYDNYHEEFKRQYDAKQAQATQAAASGGGYYKVNEDGTAPKGLQPGDFVVTEKGTYEITGVNADGSYESVMDNKKQTTKNFPDSNYSAPPTAYEIAALTAWQMAQNGRPPADIIAELDKYSETELPDAEYTMILQMLGLDKG